MAGLSQLTQTSTSSTAAEDFTLETATLHCRMLFRNIIRKLPSQDRIAALEEISLLMKSAMKRVQPQSHEEAGSVPANSGSTPGPTSAQETLGVIRGMQPRIIPSSNAVVDANHAASAPCSSSRDRQERDASASSEQSDIIARSPKDDSQESTSGNEGDRTDSDDDMPQPRGTKRKRAAGSLDESVGKRPKRPKITSLDELVVILQTQDPIVIRQNSYQPFLIVQDVMEEVLQMPEMAELKDEALAGLTLLVRIFGEDGCTQLRSLYKEHHRTHNHKSLTTAKLATTVVSDLKGLGCPTLSRLVDLWSRLESLGEGPKCKDLRRLKAHLEIVRIWESINLREGNHTEELEKLRASTQFQEFLDQQSLRGKRGQTKQSQLTSFIAHKLSIPNKNFTNTASRYKPLLILARYFGEGVLAFLPRTGLVPLFNKLHLKVRGLHGKDKGELVFCAVVEKMLEKIPGIADLCSLAFKNLVDPILEESELPSTSGLMLLEAGEIPAFQSAEVWELVTNEGTLERRIIEELSDDAPDEAIDAEEDDMAGGDSS